MVFNCPSQKFKFDNFKTDLVNQTEQKTHRFVLCNKNLKSGTIKFTIRV